MKDVKRVPATLKRHSQKDKYLALMIRREEAKAAWLNCPNRNTAKAYLASIAEGPLVDQKIYVCKPPDAIRFCLFDPC
jgi:hypothetical protein